MTLLQMQGISKRFGTIVANEDVCLHLKGGEIHALMGENGAGKSTLMNILYGLLKPDTGEIRFDGEVVHFANPLDALEKGIAMVHQTFRQFPNLTVWENMIFHHEPGRGAFISPHAARAFVRDLTKQHGLDINPDILVRDLPVGIRQRLEILKALMRRARLLILDEPTAVLTPQERDSLFIALHRLADEGMALILVTHKIPEVMAITDTITVMRDGRNVGYLTTSQTNEAEIVHMMVGRNIAPTKNQKLKSQQPPLLQVRHLRVDNKDMGAVDTISFDLHPGEIVGVAGVSGNGQHQMILALSGLIRSRGEIIFNGQDISALSIAQRRAMGLSYVPEDRHLTGTAAAASIAENMVFGTHSRPPMARWGFLRQRAIKPWARQLIKKFNIKAHSENISVGSLSGGNMQKTIIARELERNAPLLFIEEPTRGVDVGAIEFIHKTLLHERDKGKAILLVSSDLSELLALSTRVLVMFEGCIKATLSGADLNEQTIGYWMMGGEKAAA